MSEPNEPEEAVDSGESDNSQNEEEAAEDEVDEPETPETEEKDQGPAILWCGVSRDGVLLAEHLTLPEASKAALKLLQEPPNSGWDFVPISASSTASSGSSSAEDQITSTSSSDWKGCKIQIFQRNPIPAGQRVKVRGLKEHAFMNGQSVRIQEYRPETDKYVCKPTIPLTDRQDLHQSILLFKARNIVPQKKQPGKQYTIFTFGCVYNEKRITKDSVCAFLEKLLVLSEAFREAWMECGKLQAQEIFGAMIEAQIELYDSLGPEAFEDQNLSFAETFISKNIDLLAEATYEV